MCFDFCNDDRIETQTSWSPPPSNDFVTTQVIGGGLGETTVIQQSYGGGYGDSGGMGTATTWSPSQPDGFVVQQDIGGGMGSSTIMTQPSYGGGGGLGSVTISTPSDNVFVQTQNMGGDSGQLGQSTYITNAY